MQGQEGTCSSWAGIWVSLTASMINTKVSPSTSRAKGKQRSWQAWITTAGTSSGSPSSPACLNLLEREGLIQRQSEKHQGKRQRAFPTPGTKEGLCR